MNKLLKLAMCVLMGCSLLSCTSEEPVQYTSNILVKAPKMIAYSGDIYFGNGTRSAQPNANEWGTDGKYKDYPRPADITEEEIAKVLEVFNQKGKESYEPLVDWSNFFVQQVWKGTAEYIAGNGGTVVGGNQMNWLCCGSEEMGDDHVNNFNNSDGSVMLMFDSSTKRWGYKSSTDNGHIFYYFRMEYIDGAYYVGFDFSAEGQNPNEQVQRDYIYNDWIIKIVPGKDAIVTPPGTPNDPEVDDPVIGDVEHNHHNEVEVNLHADDSSILESHLSIHVRYPGDVEVFIPVPKQYYCEADDMDIVMRHELDYMMHGGPYETEYKLKDSELTVTLNVEFEEDGIRIWTDGVTQEVIDWCAEKCHGDGITFEVWNYFNDVLDIEGLKEYLNQATIRFIDDDGPDSYINAFTDSPNDCTVEIVKDQSGNYKDPQQGTHLNGSDKNQIYDKYNIIKK